MLGKPSKFFTVNANVMLAQISPEDDDLSFSFSPEGIFPECVFQAASL